MSLLRFDRNTRVLHKDEIHQIIRAIDLDRLALKSEETGETCIAPLTEVFLPEKEMDDIPNIESLSEKQIQQALYRFEIIKPLLNKRTVKNDFEKVAKSFDLSVATVYRLRNVFLHSNSLISLVSKKRGDSRKKRINKKVEDIIEKAIESTYLVLERNRMSKTIEEVQAQCFKGGLKPPHQNTIKNRIYELSEYRKTQRRFGKRIAREKFDKTQSSREGLYPLHVIEIDHTILDLQIVDDETRAPIGRPTITLAIDTYTRMVIGYYISLMRPSTMSVAMCVAHSILDKADWLASNDIPGSWPCYGFMTVLRADNGKDFHSKALEMACKLHNIQLEWRRKGDPKSGGAFIERYLGTLNGELHSIPGTTFSNVVEKGRYDSESHATLTLKALNQYVGDFIVNSYHLNKHSQLGMSPLEKWNIGIMGDKDSPGIGLPDRWENHKRLMLDFMPFEERTVQQYGVVINYLKYWGPELMPYVNSVVPENGKRRVKKSFIFKYDPTDLSKIFFYEPNLDEYISIPYADKRTPSMSLWQLRDALKNIKTTNSPIHQEQIVESYFRRKGIIEKEKKKKKETKSKPNRVYEVEKPGLKAQLDNYSDNKPVQKSKPDNDTFSDIEVLDFD